MDYNYLVIAVYTLLIKSAIIRAKVSGFSSQVTSLSLIFLHKSLVLTTFSTRDFSDLAVENACNHSWINDTALNEIFAKEFLFHLPLFRIPRQ